MVTKKKPEIYVFLSQRFNKKDEEAGLIYAVSVKDDRRNLREVNPYIIGNPNVRDLARDIYLLLGLKEISPGDANYHVVPDKPELYGKSGGYTVFVSDSFANKLKNYLEDGSKMEKIVSEYNQRGSRYSKFFREESPHRVHRERSSALHKGPLENRK